MVTKIFIEMFCFPVKEDRRTKEFEGILAKEQYRPDIKRFKFSQRILNE